MFDKIKKLFKKEAPTKKKKKLKGDKPSELTLFDQNLKEQEEEQRQEALARLFKNSIQRPMPNGVQVPGVFQDSEDGLKQLSSWGGVTQPISPGLINWYQSQVFIGYQLAGIFAQHWLIDKACSIPARDAVRKGYKITVNDGSDISPKVLEALRLFDKKRGISDQLKEYIRFGRVFGIRVMMFVVDSPDPEYYFKPFNIDGVMPGSYKGISQIDPYWVVPELDGRSAYDPAYPHFFEPTWWRVNAKRIHRSHLVICKYSEVVDILKSTYYYGGIPLPQLIFEHVYDAERTAAEAPRLAMTKRMLIFKTDAAQYVAKQNKMAQVLAQLAYLRDNFGVNVCDKNRDDLVQLETALTGFSEVMSYQHQLTAAVSGVPATKLLGTSPSGFNSSGTYEESSYHETLESIQDEWCTPAVERHHMLSIKSYICPKFNIPYFETSIEWEKLDALTEKEQAEIRKISADTALVHITAGITSPEEEREKLSSDPESGYNFIIPEDVPEVEEFSGGEEKEEDREELSAIKTERF